MFEQQQNSFTRYLTHAEEKQLIRTVCGIAGDVAFRDYCWMRLLRHTGIRVGAAARLTVHDAKEALKEGRLALRAEISKRKRGYAVPLNEDARKALRGLLTVRRRQGAGEGPDTPLIVSRKHRGLSVRSFQARMQFYRARAGLPVDASPHWFRHTLAKRVIERSTARNPLGVVMAALGHSSINSTAQYTRPDREEVAQAIEEAA